VSMIMKVARNTPGRAMPGTGFRGDPGLFGFLGKVGRKIAGAGLGIVSRAGIPGISGVAGFAGSLFGRKFKRGGKPARAPLGFQLPQSPVPGVIGAIQRGLPGGATGFEGTGPPGPGYKLNKSDYFVKADPSDPNSPGVFVPEGTRWVKIRHRNPLNPRALSKAIGRVGSAKKATTMLGRITIRKAC